MAKNKVVKSMTEEQRQRILDTPGVVVRRRTDPPSDPFFVPRLRPQVTLNVTASDLINAEDDEQEYSQ